MAALNVSYASAACQSSQRALAPSGATATARASFVSHDSRLSVRADSVSVHLRGRLGGSGGTGVLERPGLDQSVGPDGAPRTSEGKCNVIITLISVYK